LKLLFLHHHFLGNNLEYAQQMNKRAQKVGI